MGKLIVFEGLDGTGKTTLSREVVSRLRVQGIPCVRYEDIEEKQSAFNTIKDFVQTQCTVETSFFFYLASALHKSAKIRVLLESSWVVCDRYIYSTIAHHLALGMSRTLIPHIDALPLVKPDYFFMMSVDEKTRLQRAEQRAGSTCEDKQEKYAKDSLLGKKEKVILSFSRIIRKTSGELHTILWHTDGITHSPRLICLHQLSRRKRYSRTSSPPTPSTGLILPT